MTVMRHALHLKSKWDGRPGRLFQDTL